MPILPYIEQGPLFSTYKDTLDCFDSQNQAFYQTQLNVLQCPSTTLPRVSSDSTVTPAFANGAINDYRAHSGIDSSAVSGMSTFTPPVPGLVTTNGGGGMWNDNNVTPFTNCTDGLSNTFIIAEDAGFPDLWVKGKKVGTVSRPAYGVWAGRDNKNSAHGHNDTADAVAGLQYPGNCAINCCNFRGVYAFHTAGANVGMGDGSVQFLKTGTSVFILLYLSTRGGGETDIGY